MTKDQLQKKIEDMLPQVQDYLQTEVVRLFNSGGIDPQSYPNPDYILPKILLTVALENCANAYRPISNRRYAKEIANLRHF